MQNDRIIALFNKILLQEPAFAFRITGSAGERLNENPIFRALGKQNE
jgi:hypothetical protein